MTTLFCWMIGGLFAISVYLLLSQQLMRWLFGIVILSSSTTFVLVNSRSFISSTSFCFTGKNFLACIDG